MVFSVMLDYLRVLMWPVVIIAVLFFFRANVRELLGRVEKIETPAGSVGLTSKPVADPKLTKAPDVYFSLAEIADSNCSDRAEQALRGSGFERINKGQVTYGYTETLVGAFWCRPENPVLITVAGQFSELSAKLKDLDDKFHGRS